ncbi:MAG: AbrB/MazE/SpoVT family DNA-binding domain-containing protein [Spirochaetaceae bacterium]|jgi:virulence-associated protein VagC|nr:AbrB/MazE/SpoVT family DNA-binding domain-containing protein [Spirochaetaceae bacterium]
MVQTATIQTGWQVALPEELCHSLSLFVGEKLDIYPEGDTIILKPDNTPVELFMTQAHQLQKMAAEAGLTEDDITSAIKEARAEIRCKLS